MSPSDERQTHEPRLRSRPLAADTPSEVESKITRSLMALALTSVVCLALGIAWLASAIAFPRPLGIALLIAGLVGPGGVFDLQRTFRPK
jgi:hypothetical protein